MRPRTTIIGCDSRDKRSLFARNKLFGPGHGEIKRKAKEKERGKGREKEARTQLGLTITSIRGTRLDDDVLALTGTATIARRGVVAGSPSYSGTIGTACGPGGPA